METFFQDKGTSSLLLLPSTALLRLAPKSVPMLLGLRMLPTMFLSYLIHPRGFSYQPETPESVSPSLTSSKVQIHISNWCWHFYLEVPWAHIPAKPECIASFSLPRNTPPRLLCMLAHSFAGAAPWSRMPNPTSLQDTSSLLSSQSQLKQGLLQGGHPELGSRINGPSLCCQGPCPGSCWSSCHILQHYAE